MNQSERVKIAAFKRFIKREYAKSLRLAKETENYAASNFHLGTATAYFDCFRELFYNDKDMNDEIIKELLKE